MTTRFDVETLLSWLPSYLQLRDAEVALRSDHGGLDSGVPVDESGPLRSLVGAVAVELERHDRALDELYDDLFIETCAPNVVPLIGDLIGANIPADLLDEAGELRSLVANLVSDRRRKGTMSALESISDNSLGSWTVAAREGFAQVIRSVQLNQLRRATAVVDLRNSLELEQLHQPLPLSTDPLGPQLQTRVGLQSRSVDVRRAGEGGRYNVPNVGLFVWRMLGWRVSEVKPFAVDGVAGRRYTFDPLGREQNLWRVAASTAGPKTLDDVPGAFTRRLAKSLVNGVPRWQLGLDAPVQISGVMGAEICDLSDISDEAWQHDDREDDLVRIDPVLGRFVLPVAAGDQELSVEYLYGGAGISGAGVHQRKSLLVDESIDRVGAESLDTLIESGAVQIEIADSGTHSIDRTITVATGVRRTIAAGAGVRPVIKTDTALTITLTDQSDFVLDGALLDVGHIVLETDEPQSRARVRISSSTLGRRAPIRVGNGITLHLRQSICGPVELADGAELIAFESVIDAGPGRASIAVGPAGGDSLSTDGKVSLNACTVLGRVQVREVGLITDSIVTGPLMSARRQRGCIRYSALAAESAGPRQYRCTTDGAVFESLDPMDAEYVVLECRTPGSIMAGSESASEMGVYRRWRQRSRRALLASQLDDFVRFGMDVGTFNVSGKGEL